MRVAVLGMGGMGRALGERAEDRGREVVVWNRTKGKSGRLREVEEPVEAVDGAGAVLVVVHDESAVRDVCTDRLLAGLAHDACLVIVSTVPPDAVRQLAARLPGRVLDAPVLGTPDAVRSGQAQLFVGGEATAVDAVSALLDDLGAGYVRCGGPGSGSVMKILSNLQLVIGVSALAEAVATARANGVEDDVITTVFGDSVAIGQATSASLTAMLDPRHEGELGPVSDAAAVVQQAQDLARGLRPVLAPGVLELLARVADNDWPDFTAVIEGLG